MRIIHYVATMLTRSTGVALALLIAATPARAQGADYPNQRITFIVGFAAGGFADTIGRMVAGRLGERTGQTVVVQNMEGGGGIRAARRVALAAPDGYTILVTTTSLAINESLAPDRGYDTTAFAAVALPISAPEALSVSVKSPIKTLADLVSDARAGKVFMGSAGVGSGSHIAAEYFFKVLAKTPVRHIPFPGGNPAMMGLLSGDVTVLASTATGNLTRAVRNGEVIGLAIAASERTPTLPAVPTFAEAGYPGLLAASWVGFFAPGGTPEAALLKLNSEIHAILQEPEMVKRIETAGLLTTVRSRADSAKLFTSEIANWSTMVQAVGVPKH
ncbi:MAG: tripartite tricarboxylate transporter substrate binding protein [Hyphomicrobiales bacterium]|nr:tripartite tricarboxylate transporter substrate binding protein [Hyphomicrobiales bacterium]